MKTIGGGRRTLRALLTTAVVVALVGGGTASADHHVLYEYLSLNYFTSGPIKGIATIEFGDSSQRVRYALQGLPTTGQLRMVASTKPCSKAYTSASRVLAWSLGASNPTAAGEFIVDIDLTATGAYKSLRIFRGAGSGDQRACSRAVHGTLETTGAALQLENALVSSYLKAPGPRGMVVVVTGEEDNILVRASLLHKGRGTFRLVGSTAPCSEAHAGAAKVFAHTYDLGDTGTHEVGHFVNVQVTSAVSADDLRSVRLFRGAGNDDQVECRGIIAVLIGL